MGISIKGNTITNKAGVGDVSPKTITLESSKTYLLIKTDGGMVNIDGVDTAVPTKIIGKTSTTLTFATGKIGLYELLSTETGLATDLAKKYTYVSGTKSTVSASRLKSVGKNLFDGKLEIGSFDVITGKKSPSSSNVINVNKVKVQSNSAYTIKRYSGTSIRIYLYDFNENLINTTLSSGVATVKFTTPSNCAYVNFLFVGTTIDYNTQFEKGNVETTYEPYTESTQYLPNVGELRSLPNGTKDEIRVSGGKLIKRVSEPIIFNGMTTANLSETLPNTYRVLLGKVDNALPLIVNSAVGYSDNGNYYSTISPNSIDERSIHINALGDFLVRVERTKIDAMAGATTLDKIKAYLNQYPITLTYQLAEPIITPINVSGNLVSYPSGTVYVENVVADAGIYTTKFDIKELQLPIKSIDKLIKYNFETGVQTVLDTTLAVINADKKSFTHPNLVKGDMVFVDYFYDVESTLGETTIEYLDSRHTIKDTTNNKFYSWNIKSTNGVPTVALTEVL